MQDILIYGTVAAFSTIIGGLIPLRTKVKRKNLFQLIAIAAGILIAISFLEIIPEALQLSAFSGFWILAGFILMYIIERFSIAHASVEFSEKCELHRVSMMAFAGLLFHSFIDGVAIASSFIISQSLGMIVTLAVLMHEFPEGLATSALLLATKYSRIKIFYLLTAVALATPAGAIIFLIFKTAEFLPLALGIAAGTFVYIGSADMLPQLHKEKSEKIFFSFLLGILLILVARLFAL